MLDVDIGLLCNLFFVKCVLFIGNLFSTVLVLGLQVPTLGIDLNFVSSNKLLTSSAPLMLLSRLPPSLLNPAWKSKLQLPTLEHGLF